jgi:hypothetical protein
MLSGKMSDGMPNRLWEYMSDRMSVGGDHSKKIICGENIWEIYLLNGNPWNNGRREDGSVPKIPLEGVNIHNNQLSWYEQQGTDRGDD